MSSWRRNVWVLALPALIVLKLAGVIDWSWWWVLAPLWIGGPLTVAFVWLAVASVRRNRRAKSPAVRDGGDR